MSVDQLHLPTDMQPVESAQYPSAHSLFELACAATANAAYVVSSDTADHFLMVEESVRTVEAPAADLTVRRTEWRANCVRMTDASDAPTRPDQTIWWGTDHQGFVGLGALPFTILDNAISKGEIAGVRQQSAAKFIGNRLSLVVSATTESDGEGVAAATDVLLSLTRSYNDENGLRRQVRQVRWMHNSVDGLRTGDSGVISTRVPDESARGSRLVHGVLLGAGQLPCSYAPVTPLGRLAHQDWARLIREPLDPRDQVRTA